MIFTSQPALNLDPEPFVQVYASVYYPPFSRRAVGGGGAAYEPRPEFTVTRDPAPFRCPATGWRSSSHLCEGRLSKHTFEPRQMYRAPVNRILAEFRRSSPWVVADAAKVEADWLIPGAHPVPADATPDEIEHAHRVLRRIVALADPEVKPQPHSSVNSSRKEPT